MQKDSIALNVLHTILPRTELSMCQICRQLINLLYEGDADTAASLLRQQLRRNTGLHVSSLDADDTGYFLWAITFGLTSVSNRESRQSTIVFLKLLSILVRGFGASIDQRGKLDGRAPLQYVAKAGNPRALEAMIKMGAQVNLCDKEGWTALHAVCMNDVKQPQNDGPSHADRVRTAQLLIQAGANLEACSHRGMTPLITVCHSACPPLLEFLLSQGANPHHKSQNGRSAMIYLYNCERNETIKAQSLDILRRYSQQREENEDSKVMKLKLLVGEVLVPAPNHIADEVARLQETTESRLQAKAMQRRHNLEALLVYFQMDPRLHDRPIDNNSSGNWLGELHTKIFSLLPHSYQEIYRRQPNDEELAIIMSGADGPLIPYFAQGETVYGSVFSKFDKEAVLQFITKPFRQRGRVIKSTLMMNFRNAVIEPLQRCVSFAIPNRNVVDRIACHGPIVEVGAGTGYWTAVLRARGVDAIAYDLHPPEADHTSNRFFDSTFTTVRKGDATTAAFWNDNDQLYKRTLLIVWPNNPDEVDNLHLHRSLREGNLPPTWDATCLEQYLESGGKTVIYVGEREDAIQVNPGYHPDCGISSSRRFQTILKERFDMVEQISIPTLLDCEDDATIWQRK